MRYVKFFNLAAGLEHFKEGRCDSIQETAYLEAIATPGSPDVNFAIIPAGTGAIVASCPDGTAAGGNARGAYAVDLQLSRAAAFQVSSGQYSVSAGQGNTASGEYSLAFGGRDNYATSRSTVAIGETSQATANYAAAIGGLQNTSSGQYSISGGYSNVASGQGAVALGYDNTASGQRSVAMGYFCTSSATDSGALSGQSNSAVSAYSVVCGGLLNVAGGVDSISTVVGGRQNRAWASFDFIGAGYSNSVISYAGAIVGGYDNEINNAISCFIGAGRENYISGGAYQVANGYQTKGILRTQNSFSGGQFSSKGDSQYSDLIARKQDTLTTGATTTLSLDGTGTTNLIIPDGNNRLWAAKITATAFVSAVSGTTLVLGDSYMAEYTVLFKRVGGTSSVVGTNAGNIIADANMISSTFTFAAGASNDLEIKFNAPSTASADTFRCVAKVELVEVAY